VTLLLHQLRFERKLFRRNPSAAFFNFVLPLVLLLLVASVFADDDEELEILIPGIAGMAIMATTFTALAFNVVFLREQGLLKRIRGTPIPPGSYLGGLVGSAVVNAVVQVVLVFAIGKLFYDVDLPDERGHRRRRVRGARHRVRACDPELRRRRRVHERGLSAARVHLRRLLLRGRPPTGVGGDRRGATPEACDRRPRGGRHRRRFGHRRGMGSARCHTRCALLPLGLTVPVAHGH